MFGKKPPQKSFQMLAEEQVSWTSQPEDLPMAENDISNIDPVLIANLRHSFFERIDPASAADMTVDQLSFTVIQVVSSIVLEEKLQLNWQEQGAIAKEILDDIVGIGPIEDLLSDESITDILVNGPNTVFVERKGLLERTPLKFRDELHLFEVARRIANSVGRRLDEASPMVDARLEDGSRVNVIAPPLSVNGTIISIRKFSPEVMALSDLLSLHTLSEEICRFLETAMHCRLNILVSGGTGSGKTTFLNAISSLIDEADRVVTIEDTVEIRLQSPHVVSLETRQQNSEGAGEVTQRDLLRNCLRMRPDRIIVGEVRSSEAYDMLQAMNTGHDGSMSTIHANSCRDALIRLENLVLVSQPNLQASNARQQIASAVDLVIHMQRTLQGSRVIGAISEVVGIEGDTITLQDLFHHAPITGNEDVLPSGSPFQNSGLRPHFLDKADRSELTADLPFQAKD